MATASCTECWGVDPKCLFSGYSSKWEDLLIFGVCGVVDRLGLPRNKDMVLICNFPEILVARQMLPDSECLKALRPQEAPLSSDSRQP